MLINAGAISGFDDAAGLRRFLERANQLENNLVAMCDAKCAQVTSNVNKVAKTLRLQAEKHEPLYADCRVEYDANVEKLKQLQQEAQEVKLKLKYLESKSKNDDDFFKFTEMHAKEGEKLGREWEQVHRINGECKQLREERQVLLAAAKKRARDSSSVESTIVRKLVRRCHQCSLCSVCEHTHDRYRRSKYGDDSF